MFELYLREAFILLCIFSAIPLLVSSAGGLVVSILQAATQIQEQSISFAVKLILLAVTMLLIGEWFFQELVAFFQESLQSFPQLGEL